VLLAGTNNVGKEPGDEAKMADGQSIRFLDVNARLADAEGRIRPHGVGRGLAEPARQL
jgi:hypothetical protein